MDQRGRAAVTIAQPLDAEVFVDGIWWPGAVLGWRHDELGRCEASVRVHLAGGARVLGVDLAAVRLPEIPGASADAPEAPAETVVISRAALRERLGGALAGRHRAPASSGRHRAGDEVVIEPKSGLLTRPIRLDDVAAWSWGSSSVASA